MCIRMFTVAEEDELIAHLVKTTHEALLHMVPLCRRIGSEDIKGDVLAESPKKSPDVPSAGVCPSCGVRLGYVIQKDSVDGLQGSDSTL